MNYLKTNKEFLREYRIDLLELVRGYEKTNRYAKNIEWDETVREIKVKQGKKNLYLHSIYNKEREIEKLLQNKPKQVEQLCFFGLPDPKQMKIIFNYFKRFKRLFIVVPSVGIFYKWLQYNSLSAYLDLVAEFISKEEIVILVGDEYEQVENMLNAIINVAQHEKIAMLPFLSYLTLFTDFFAHICQSTKIALSDKGIMEATRKFWRGTWLIHNWEILNEKTINLMLLKKMFANNACIVVAAGASLEKNIELLREARNKAIIIAAGTAASVLAQQGIKPHFHIGVDGSDLANKIFSKVKDGNVPLICSYSFYSPLVKEYRGQVFAFAIDAMDKIAIAAHEYLKEELLISTGGLSVVNIAHAIAAQLGCKKIIMVGQDCCFSGNKMHAKGSWSEGKKHNEEVRSILLEDIHGQPVYTLEVFLGIKRAIERFIATATGCKVINATEGGLPIVGANNMTLRNVIDKELRNNVNIEAIIEEISEKALEENHSKLVLLKEYAIQYRQQMYDLQELLLTQHKLLKQAALGLDEQLNYENIISAIEIFKSIEKNEAYAEMISENYIFDINEALLLDLGKYSYELLEGITLVNKRLLDYVQVAIVLATENIEKNITVNKVMYVRHS